MQDATHFKTPVFFSYRMGHSQVSGRDSEHQPNLVTCPAPLPVLKLGRDGDTPMTSPNQIDT